MYLKRDLNLLSNKNILHSESHSFFFLYCLAGVCGGTLTSPTGIIMSPLYPSLYPSNSDCTWIIKPPSAKDISLTFEAFDLEADANCGYDSVKVSKSNS